MQAGRLALGFGTSLSSPPSWAREEVRMYGNWGQKGQGKPRTRSRGASWERGLPVGQARVPNLTAEPWWQPHLALCCSHRCGPVRGPGPLHGHPVSVLTARLGPAWG